MHFLKICLKTCTKFATACHTNINKCTHTHSQSPKILTQTHSSQIMEQTYLQNIPHSAALRADTSDNSDVISMTIKSEEIP